MAAGKKKPVDQSRTEWVPKGTVVNGKPVPKGYLAQKGRPDKKVTNAVRIQTDTTSGKKAGETYAYKQGRTVGQVTKGQQTGSNLRRKPDGTQAAATGNNPPPPPRGGRTGRPSSAANKMTPAQKRAYEVAQRNRPAGRTGQSSSAANNMTSTQAGRYNKPRTTGSEQGLVGRAGKGTGASPAAQLAILKRRLGAMQIGAARMRAKAAMTAADRRAAAEQQKQIADLQAAIRRLGG